MSEHPEPSGRPLWGPVRRPDGASPTSPYAGPGPDTLVPDHGPAAPGASDARHADTVEAAVPAASPGPHAAGPYAYRPTPPPPAGPIPPRYGEPPPPPGRNRSRLVAIAVAAATLLVLAGGGVVFATNRVDGSGATSGGGSAGTTGAVGPASVDPLPSGPTAATAAPDPVLRSASGLVQAGTVAAAHPEVGTVLDLFDRHFTAINQRDYAAWATTVSARRAEGQPQGRWLQDYRSTRDSDVRIGAITGGTERVVVDLEFVSEQDVADAPADLPVTRICWSVRWPVTDLDGGGAVDNPPRGSTSKRAC